MQRILEEIKSNTARRALCAGPHEFVQLDANFVVCRKCAGEMHKHDLPAYREGARHGMYAMLAVAKRNPAPEALRKAIAEWEKLPVFVPPAA